MQMVSVIVSNCMHQMYSLYFICKENKSLRSPPTNLKTTRLTFRQTLKSENEHHSLPQCRFALCVFSSTVRHRHLLDLTALISDQFHCCPHSKH